MMTSRVTPVTCFVAGACASVLAISLLGANQNAARRQTQQDVDVTSASSTTSAETPDDGKLRIIVFGAHPDDCELKAAGVAAKWAAQGHHVKFVSLTNGDVGHWQSAGGPLARRRTEEVQRCAEILG